VYQIRDEIELLLTLPTQFSNFRYVASFGSGNERLKSQN